jgi:tRNA-specific 2-thiouridylase
MRILVAMSGGVDSSVAAARLATCGYSVVGATLKLWKGSSTSGCCSVADVDDARRVAEQLGITHHVFDDTDAFEAHVVNPYVTAHAGGSTPNPCIECNRHIKFGLLIERARRLGFDAVATGHHARVSQDAAGAFLLRRGRDLAKDQSYVLSMLTQVELSKVMLPVGEMTKGEVRKEAARLGLRTADKPDSQDVCFVASQGGRRRFLEDRIALHAGTVVDARSGEVIGAVPAVEMVTLGQRRGLGLSGKVARRYVVGVDLPSRRVLVGGPPMTLVSHLEVGGVTWVGLGVRHGAPVLVQASAHGPALPGRYFGDEIRYDVPQRAVAPGQTLAMYDPLDGESVVGSAIVVGSRAPSGLVVEAALESSGA